VLGCRRGVTVDFLGLVDVVRAGQVCPSHGAASRICSLQPPALGNYA
jgi:hypothetical protein